MNWISVKEKMPDKYTKVLCYYSDKYIDVLEYWYDEDGKPLFFNPPIANISDVTHWMPLPESPKEKTL